MIEKRVFANYIGACIFVDVPGPGCLTMGHASEVCFQGMLRGMLRTVCKPKQTHF